MLIVDDNAAKRLALRAMLAPLGHAVVEAESGRAALRAVLRQDFAVILMDVRMPIMDGYETAKLIRERGQSALTPFIFVTAFGGEQSETINAYNSGAVDFIFTPVHAEVLRAKISAFVNLFVQTQELQRSLNSVTALHVALRDSEVRARAVLQNVADGIVTAGHEGLIVLQPVGAATVRLLRGGGHRRAAGDDRRAQPPRGLLRARARTLESADGGGLSRRAERDGRLP